MKPRQGMAIAVVLGFIFTALILGATLLFVSRAGVHEADTLQQRMQHFALAEAGLAEALAKIKIRPLRALIDEHGPRWTFSTAEQSFGKAKGQCRVSCRQKSDRELIITVDAEMATAKGPPRVLVWQCRARYREYQERTGRNRILTRGRWTIEGFQRRTETPDGD